MDFEVLARTKAQDLVSLAASPSMYVQWRLQLVDLYDVLVQLEYEVARRLMEGFGQIENHDDARKLSREICDEVLNRWPL